MNARTFVRTAAVFVLAASSAAFAASSPLDADYYQGKPSGNMAAAQATGYVDSANPLTPTFHQGKPTVTYQATAARIDRPYVDSSNPRDPSYRAK